MIHRIRKVGRTGAVAAVLLGLAMVLCDPAAARQARASHQVTVGIRPIVAFAAELPGGALAPGIEREAAFALTSNVDGTRLVASLDEPLPEGVGLALRAQCDLAHPRGSVVLRGTDPVVLLDGLARGVRSGQPIWVEVRGQLDPADPVVRTLTLALEDPESGLSSAQSVRLRLERYSAEP